MKKVMDYFREVDKMRLVDNFFESYIVLCTLVDITKEELLILLDDICETNSTLVKTSHIIFCHSTYFDHGIIRELQIISITNLLRDDDNTLNVLETVPLKMLLGALVSTNTCQNEQINYILLKTLYVAFMEMWGNQIFCERFDDNGQSQVAWEMTIVPSKEESRFLESIENAISDLDRYFLCKELSELKYEVINNFEVKYEVENDI